MKKYLLALTVSLLASSVAFAQEAAATGASEWTPLGLGLLMGLAVFGGTSAQGKAIAASVESMGRNPSIAGKVQTAMILGLALIESLVILGFVIAFMQM